MSRDRCFQLLPAQPQEAFCEAPSPSPGQGRVMVRRGPGHGLEVGLPHQHQPRTGPGGVCSAQAWGELPTWALAPVFLFSDYRHHFFSNW